MMLFCVCMLSHYTVQYHLLLFHIVDDFFPQARRFLARQKCDPRLAPT